MLSDNLALIGGALAFGAAFGALILWIVQRIKLTNFKQIAAQLIQKAELDGEAIRKSGEMAAKHCQIDQQREFEQRWQQERRKLQNEEERLKQREDKLESRMNLVEKKLFDTEKREAILIARKTQLEEERKVVAEPPS